MADVSRTAPGLPAVAATLLARLDSLAAQMTARIRDEIDFYVVSDDVPDSSLAASVQDNLRLILRALIAGEPPDLAAAHATGRERARQAAPLPEVLAAFRVGFGALWAAIAAEARASRAIDDAALVDMVAEVWQLAGDVADAMTAAYRDAVAEMMLRDEHRRSVLVEALLSGEIADQRSLWETAHTLRLPVEGRFLVVAAATPEPGREALPEIASRLDASDIRSAWRLQPNQQIGVLSLPPSATVDGVLAVLRRTNARAGVSPLYSALRETPQALQFARLALRGLGEGEVAQFADTPLAVLMAAAPAEAGQVAARVLGPVLALGDGATLVDTLECWFGAGGSAGEAARRLFCHPNTVRYRLRRIEELTGRKLADPAAVAELSAALQALRMLP
ncbi:hypothetical protein CF166_27355 [Amycolatopsis sp. KNN50.9b]|nr:hypothetical protein CF166_27355 [Amycolatopsis sp. KNN50.9b]